jgi:cellulase/cellobiase CelA1
VIVVLNTATSAISTSYTLTNTGLSTGTVAPFLTNTNSSMAAQPTTALAGGTFATTVPARSLVTYRITGGAGPPPSATTPPATTTPATTPPATTPPATTTSPNPPPTTPNNGSGCTATYRIVNSWNGGFQAEVAVTNNGSTTTNGWTARWTLPNGETITQLWNGTLSVAGSNVTVTNLSYNGSIAPNASTSFGFTGAGPSTPPVSLSCTSP